MNYYHPFKLDEIIVSPGCFLNLVFDSKIQK